MSEEVTDADINTQKHRSEMFRGRAGTHTTEHGGLLTDLARVRSGNRTCEAKHGVCVCVCNDFDCPVL